MMTYYVLVNEIGEPQGMTEYAGNFTLFTVVAPNQIKFFSSFKVAEYWQQKFEGVHVMVCRLELEEI